MKPNFPRAAPERDSPFTLPRSGGRPLAFTGRLVAEAGEAPTDKHTVRWHELKLYRAASGVYVVSIQFKTTSRHETPYDDAFVCETAEAVIELLEEYDPVEYVLGWPVPQYGDKDRRVREALLAQFELLVSALLSGSEEFAEKV